MNKITKHMEFKSWINLQQPFYHGSFSSIPIGTILTPNSQNYEKNWATSLPYYDILEKLRPKHMIALKDAIFMCDNLDDIDLAGGSTEYIYLVKPFGKVEKHDQNWTSEIQILLEDDFITLTNKKKIVDYARKYWNGEPHFNESVWEYLTPKAQVIELVEE